MSAPLRLDAINQCLWRGTQPVALTPKAFTVLRHLMDHAGQLVTKEELLNAAWPEVYVSDAALKVCIRRLRLTLGDHSRAPQFIETIPWRGYRFIGTIPLLDPASPPPRSAEPSRRLPAKSHSRKPQRPLQPALQSRREKRSPQLVSPLPPLPLVSPQLRPTPLVGRTAALQKFHQVLHAVVRGERHTLFVTGEAGIGKTTLIEAFLEAQHADALYWVARGQCIEHYGTGEPYLPILEAMDRLCRQPGHEQLAATLRQHAPTWLTQMPSALTPTERKRLRREVQGISQDHMLREMVDIIERLATEKPFVFVLEDLHWSDYATLDLVALLARRREAARVLVVATYRPEDINSPHPLKLIKHELLAHGQCQEIALDFLSEAAVSEYLAVRFPQGAFVPALAQAIHQRSEGNPLFMVNMVEFLIGQGVLRHQDGRWELQEDPRRVSAGVPANLQEMIEAQIDRLSQEHQQILEIASVAGIEFSTAAVAVGLAREVSTVEDQCTHIVRHAHFLQPSGESTWPDGTFSTQYKFIHSLYQQVLYHRLPAGKRAQVHQRIGHQLEEAYGSQTEQVATELAVHFERGREYPRAIHYHRLSADTALQRYAYREAIAHLTVALEFLKTEPDTAERTQQQIALYSTLGSALIATQGYAAPAVERAYDRARFLCHQGATTIQAFSALRGLWAFYIVRADFQTTRELADQLLEITHNENDPSLVLEAHRAMGQTLYALGELEAARQHLERSHSLYQPQAHHLYVSRYGQDPDVVCLSYCAMSLLLLGAPEQAQQQSEAALTLATEQGHPYTLALAYYYASILHQFLRNPQRTHELATATIALSQDQGFAYCLAAGTVLQGWALAVQGQEKEGLRLMHDGVSAYETTGAAIARPYFHALLAEVYGKIGQTRKGLQSIQDAFATVHDPAHYIYGAELYRIRGELLHSTRYVSQAHKEDAESCFHQALAIARHQGAKLFELRTLVSASRYRAQQHLPNDTLQQLATVFHWFREGADIPDLRAAKALLANDM